MNIKILKTILSLSAIGGLLLATLPALADQGIGTIPNVPSGTGTSHNWAGYVASSGNYTFVSGSWTVPQPTNTGNVSADATWVGIGGVTSSDLLQIGTQAIANSSGNISYQAWYEMLPANSKAISITVSPGDSITAYISQQPGGQWFLNLRDNTNGQNFQVLVSYNSSLSSAEWIEEMPSSGNSFFPLDNFGTVQFTGGQVIQNGTAMDISQTGANSVTMINNSGQSLTAVSALNADGASFSISRTQVSPSVAVQTVPGRIGWQRVGVRVSAIAAISRSRSHKNYFRGFGNRLGSFSFSLGRQGKY